MKKTIHKNLNTGLLLIIIAILFSTGCRQSENSPNHTIVKTPEYFNLRPEVEKAYGYTHAVRIGSYLIVSGAVSMNDSGAPTAVGDLQQQMRNCYSDLEKVLQHYGYTFNDVVVENIFTTNMAEFLKESGYRNIIYNKDFPTGTWLEVKGLALPEFMIEIELEAYKSM